MTVDDYIARRTRSNAPEQANIQSLLSGPRGLLGVARPRLAEVGPPREEAAGYQRYMRPECQSLNFNRATQADLGTEEDDPHAWVVPKGAPAAGAHLQWPKPILDQAAAIVCLMKAHSGDGAITIMGLFNDVKQHTIVGRLETLLVMGR